MTDLQKGQLVGGVGAFLGLVTAVGIIALASSNSDTQWAFVDGSILTAISLLAIRAAHGAAGDPRRSSLTLFVAGVIGFFVTGLVWVIAGGAMIAGGSMVRREFLA